MDFKNRKKKIHELKFSRLLPFACNFQKESSDFGKEWIQKSIHVENL
jgi:hypothetical protein